MAPPDGDRSKRLPTLSWESVVSDTDVVERLPSPDVEPASPVVPAPRAFTPVVEPDVFEPIVFVPAVIRPVIAAVGPERDAEPISSIDDVGGAEPLDALPPIVEATPSVDITTTLAALQAPATTSGVGPLLPSVPQPALRPAPVAGDVDEMPVAVVAPTRRGKKRPRRVLKLLITMVILGGLVAGGVVFGKPYLFPGGWDAGAEAYGKAVETARGVEFSEPPSVIVEPTADFDARSSRELLGSWSSDQPMWRALGLSNGAVDEQTVSALFVDWRDAAYSTDDGQVYLDDAPVGPELDADTMLAMAAASLDQEFGWSVDQPTRTLDGMASTSAEVLRQSRAILQDSPFAAPLDAPSLAVLSYAPPVLGYRSLATELFAEFDNARTEGQNPLVELDQNGPGALRSVSTTAATGPVLVGGDVALTAPRQLDRSFWYLALAGYVDMPTAHTASEAIVENSVVTADRAGIECVYATFAGGDLIQTDALRTALQAWSASAPVEYASSFSVLDDGSLQLVSCDPGVGFDGNSRFGVARELAAWRLAELATIEHVRAAGLDGTAAWDLVSASNAIADLVALPADTPAAEMAATARASVASALTPAG